VLPLRFCTIDVPLYVTCYLYCSLNVIYPFSFEYIMMVMTTNASTAYQAFASNLFFANQR
jgi:hypothetical protein